MPDNVFPKLKLRVERVKEQGEFVRRYHVRVTDLRWFAQRFEDYTMGQRIPNMMRNQGLVKGRSGRGYTKWADNTPWVRRAKADSRVFFRNNRTESSLTQHFQFSSWYRSGREGRASFTLRNTHPAIDYIQRGHSGFSIRAKNAKCLAIPHGFGQVVLVKSAQIGPMPPRQVEGFREGDEDWCARGIEEGCAELKEP